MADIDEMRLRRLDLTLLLVFLGLMRHRKAASVAGHMGLTQSSISHALKRLRDIFEDRLFLRLPHGLEPTAVAVALEPVIQRVVDTLEAAISETADRFDPGVSRRSLRIAAYDYELAAVVPPLITRLDWQAPGMRLATRPFGRDDALKALAAGTVDLALGYFWNPGEAFIAEKLYEETYRVVARSGHPLMAGPMTAEAYASARHLVVSPAGDLSGVVDQSLRPLGLTRHVAAAVPLFFPALAAVAESDLLATLPSRLVLRFAEGFGLRSQAPPIAIRPFAVSAVRHRRDEKNPLHGWLVGEIRATLDGRTPTSPSFPADP